MAYFKHFIFVIFCILVSGNAVSDDSYSRISPLLRLISGDNHGNSSNFISKASSKTTEITVRFKDIPSHILLDRLERSGLTFFRHNGTLLHTRHIYCATAIIDSLSSLSRFTEIVSIETTIRPSLTSTLNVSADQVQSKKLWPLPISENSLDGSGIVIVNVDTGVDIYHPGLFKPDGGTFSWIDTDMSGDFTAGIDAVDFNGNGQHDSNETLNFYEPFISDPLDLIHRTDSFFDSDFDWLYNDSNSNGFRDYGPDNGYSETDPCFGEIVFVTNDSNQNNILDIDETLTALSTSKIRSIYDSSGPHFRGIDLFSASHDSINHGTGSTGILGGGVPGRRFTGMAPGAEFIVIDRSNIVIEKALLWAASQNPDIMQYEFASWVYEFLDGSSNLEVLLDDLTDQGIHQFTASGNLAGPARKKHAFVSINGSETENISFTVPEINISQVYCSLLWRSKYLAPKITLHFPDGSELILPRIDQDISQGDFRIQSGLTFSDRQTSRLDILISSDSSISGNFSFDIENIRASTISVDAYITDNKTQWMNGTQFTSHVTDDGTVCSPGTALSGITVGAYDPRGTRNTKGDLNDFSSWGDTIDGRRAVDITAPGTLVYSYNSHAAIGGVPGSYIDFGGTSAALPHVTGAAAQLLQFLRSSDSYLESSLFDVLLNGAKSDIYTGFSPNSKWGYGKLRIFDSLKNLGITNISSNNLIMHEPFTISDPSPNPFNAEMHCDITNIKPEKTMINITIFNILGQNVFSKNILLNGYEKTSFYWNAVSDSGNNLSSGIYIMNFNDNEYSKMSKIVYLQ